MQPIFVSRMFATFCLTAVAVMTLARPTLADFRYKITPLISDGSTPAANTNPNLINPWGISYAPTGPFWLSDNGTGVTTLNRGDGSAVPLVVSIPGAGGAPSSAPTGQVFVGGQGFATNAAFAFVTENGTISSWTGANGTNAVLRVDNSVTQANYKGVATGTSGGSNFLYAADFHNGKIDVYDTSFGAASLTGGFVDPGLPTGYAPFNIQNIGGRLLVAYAKQDAGAVDSVNGAGFGFVDVFNTDGTFASRLVSGTDVVGSGGVASLNSPWAFAQAPSAGFGDFNNALLVGNFGTGEISAFDPTTGAFLGALLGLDSNNPLQIDGLRGLTFGNGTQAGLTDTLYFTAGPAGGTQGIFGSISAVTVPEANTLWLALVAAGGVGMLHLVRRRRTA